MIVSGSTKRNTPAPSTEAHTETPEETGTNLLEACREVSSSSSANTVSVETELERLCSPQPSTPDKNLVASPLTRLSAPTTFPFMSSSPHNANAKQTEHHQTVTGSTCSQSKSRISALCSPASLKCSTSSVPSLKEQTL